MSRFVRASKYRHVFGQPAKKELCIDNIKVSNNAWDTNYVSASGAFISINWNAGGGGAFAVLPAPSPFRAHNLPYKLPDVIPLARGHTAPVLDTEWSPHDDHVVASGGEDGHVLVWKIDPSSFENWGHEKWVPVDYEPVLRIGASPRKIGQVHFHPTAKHVLASASGEHTIKLWDLGVPEDPQIVLGGHTDTIQSLAWNMTGTTLATTCRDRKLRLFDPRAGTEAVRVADGHSGIKGTRVVWMGEKDIFATTGFSKMSDRQVCVWEAGSLNNIKTLSVDQSAGVLMPFWSDNGILFLAGKGDGNIRYYEYESDNLFSLDQYQSNTPQRGLCFLPRRALSVPDCEIARAFKLAGNSVEPIGFVVPRKADSFQSDIFPPAPSAEPSLSAGEFFSGKFAPPKFVSLDTGAVVDGSSTYTPHAQQTSSHPPVHAPTKTASAPAPEPIKIAAPFGMTRRETEPATPRDFPVSSSTPVVTQSISTPVELSKTPVHVAVSSPDSGHGNGGGGANVVLLQEENTRLNAELREARTLIRELELKVEALKTNAARAAKHLME